MKNTKYIKLKEKLYSFLQSLNINLYKDQNISEDLN